MQVLQCQQKLFFAFLLNASLKIIALRQTKPLRYLCVMHKNNFFCGLETLKIIVLVTQILLKKMFPQPSTLSEVNLFFLQNPQISQIFVFFSKKMKHVESYCKVDTASPQCVLVCKDLFEARCEYSSRIRMWN